MDVSENVHQGATDLKKAVADLIEQGYALPPIDFSTLLQNTVTVFRSPDTTKAPTIIYIAPIKDDGYDPTFDPAEEFSTTYKTANFSYNRQDIERLIGLFRFSLSKNENEFRQVIKDTINAK